MVKLAEKIATTTVRSMTVNLTSEDIIELLRAKGIAVADNAAISVVVPGGGDWSNCVLPIEDYRPVTVSWTVVETSP